MMEQEFRSPTERVNLRGRSGVFSSYDCAPGLFKKREFRLFVQVPVTA